MPGSCDRSQQDLVGGIRSCHIINSVIVSIGGRRGASALQQRRECGSDQALERSYLGTINFKC